MSSMMLVLARSSGTSPVETLNGLVTPRSHSTWRQSRINLYSAWWKGHGDGSYERKLVPQAGLGRYSGAIHGNRSKKMLRRHPSEITPDEHNEQDKLHDNGANLRGAYGDDIEKGAMVNDPDTFRVDNVESTTDEDEFHSDGISINNIHESHFQVFDEQGSTISQVQGNHCSIGDQGPTHNNFLNRTKATYDKATLGTNSVVENTDVEVGIFKDSGVLLKEQRVEPITVVDGSGKETTSLVDINLGDMDLNRHSVGSAKTAARNAGGKVDGIKDNEEDKDSGLKRSSVDGEEVDHERSGTNSDRFQSPLEVKREVDRSKSGTAKPSMQRRNSRGKKKKLPSTLSSFQPPIAIPEEVAPVAATILTNPEIFMDSENSRAFTSDIDRGQGHESKPFYMSRLKSYDKDTMGRGSRGLQREIRSKDISNMDNTCVRTSVLEAERPAQVAGSVRTAYANVGVRENSRGDVPARVQPPDFDMNESSGHIQQRRMKTNILAGLPRLIRPKRQSDGETDNEAKFEGTLESRETSPTSEVSTPDASTLNPPPFKLVTNLPSKVVQELPSRISELPVKVVKDFPVKVAEFPNLPSKVVKEVPIVAELTAVMADLPAKVAEIPAKIVVETAQILKTEVVEPVVEILPDAVVEQVGAVAEQVAVLQNHFSGGMSRAAGQVKQIGQNLVDHVTDGMYDSMVDHNNSIVRLQEQVSTQVDQVSTKVSEQVSGVSSQVIESVSTTAAQVTETVTATVADVTESVQSTAAQVTESVQSTATKVSNKAAEVSSSLVDFLTTDDEDSDSDDEFETFKTSDSPEFRGLRGLQNFQVLQEDEGIFFAIYDFYIYMLKKPLPQFACGMFAAPVLLSVVFTFLYLPDCKGLALDETARSFFDSNSGTGDVSTGGLILSWLTLFQVFMFSLSLSTGLQPELAPLSPYTLVLANINALIAQLIFVFLSGAVFARLSQPSQPVRCSRVALICPSLAQRRRRVDYSATKVLMARYVLAGPQPCELVDVKVDLTYKYNTLTRSGSFFRATQSLKLVRSEIAYLNQGMLVRHIIDESSPIYRRTNEMLRREDAIFTLSVVGLERASMQSVFHVQHYCVCDDHIIWDAEFEDMMLINKKNKRIVDHSKLSLWRPV